MMKLALTLLLGSLAPFASAQENDIPTTAVNSGRLSTLVAALAAANLVDTLSDPNGPFTVFAPTDDAFAALPTELVPCRLEADNVDTLTSILTYHVVDGAVFSSDLVDGMMAETLTNESISIDLSDGVTINRNASVTSADVEASNGVIHIIDSVLVPPSVDVAALATCAETPDPTPDETLFDIPTTATNAGIFDTLVAALQSADLVTALSEPNGPFTVFAPADDAFASFPSFVIECLLLDENAAALSRILTYHVVEGALFEADLTDNLMLETLDGESITIDVLSTGVSINDAANVTTEDVEASNGVIHVIDYVLIPPDIDFLSFAQSCPNLTPAPTPAPTPAAPTAEQTPEVVDIPTTATEAGNFSTLVAALDAADLVGALAEPNGPFTVFAPTDDAFAAIPDGLVSCLFLPENSEVLSSILTYHVVEGAVESGDLEDGMTPATLQGETVSIDLSDGFTINDSANVVTPDVLATNGVIHVIDSVLVPLSINVGALLANCPPEDAPTAAPEDAPMATPEEAPMAAPEDAPMADPTASPEDAPTAFREDVPTTAPEDAPTAAPEDAGAAVSSSASMMAATAVAALVL